MARARARISHCSCEGSGLALWRARALHARGQPDALGVSRVVEIIAMIFAHQEVSDIKQPETRSALTGMGLKFFNSTGEAHELASRLAPGTDPEFIANLPTGTVAAKIDIQRPMHLRIRYVPVRDDHALLDHLYLPDHELHELRSKMHKAFCALGAE
jgi:hypothetical protein